jgi:hypothetical protein
MIRGFSILLTIFILFCIFYFEIIIFVYIFLILLAITIITLILEDSKIYTYGILIGGIKMKQSFVPYRSIKKVKISYYQEWKKKKLKVFQIFYSLENKEKEFKISGILEDEFLKNLERILKTKCSNAKWIE